jgi:selenocysteine-specific elongation factor
MMKNIIIGTAGHIDHGKTTLIKALTGRNTDRFEEEQRRGITIDLGFTYFDLPNGNRVGIIDVPGHEKFINNMVAGVVGMDLVLLVIAADEGIMPQTREHMDILHLLGIEKSIIVLNKCDIVDEDWLELVESDIITELEGTFLEQAPIVKVSAVTGEGLTHLTEVIEEMTDDEVTEKDTQTIPRLPIDRVFSISGFGTIITGTLVSGTITKDAELMMYPVDKACKIRSIQVHGKEVKACYAGQRVAINISNVKKDEIKRGCVLAPKNSMKKTDLLDVKLEVLKSSDRILTNHARLHFFTGTAQLLCRAVLLDKEEIGPGESGYVQLRLEEEIALRRGDKFIVRFYSPMETIGGGVVLEPNPKIKRRFNEKAIRELAQKEKGSTADVIKIHIEEAGVAGITIAELAKMTALSIEEVQNDIEELEDRREIIVFELKKDKYCLASSVKEGIKTKLLEILHDYEEKYPYRYGEEKARVYTNYFKMMKPLVFDKLLEQFETEGVLKRKNEYISTPAYEIRKDVVFANVRDELVSEFDKARYDFVKYSAIVEDVEAKVKARLKSSDKKNMDCDATLAMTDKNKDCDAKINVTDKRGTFIYDKNGIDVVVTQGNIEDILNILVTEGEIVKVAEDIYTLREYIERAKVLVLEKLAKNSIVTIAEIRDELGTTRKSAKPILEYMDSIRVTKKAGAETERMAY